MKAKIIILTPVYNDWKNLSKLLAKINMIFKNKIKTNFDLVVVNDCSTESFNYKKLKFKNLNKITLISLFKNVGSQRALAIGIKFINKMYKKNYRTIIIDSDGQDNPKGILKMLKVSNLKPNNAIVVNRGQRKESLWFKIFYEVYNILVKLFTGKKLRFGNFSYLNSKDIKNISNDKDLWSAFPPIVSNNLKNISYITMDREKRFSGDSKMNFFGLFLHALRVFSALRSKIIISSVIYLFFAFFMFYKYEFFIIFYLILFCLFLLNLSNFIMTYSNKKKFLYNFKKAKIRRI